MNVNEFTEDATQRALDLAADMFPKRLGSSTPDEVRVCVGLLARCLSIADTCLLLAREEHEGDLIVMVRTLFEHAVTFAWLVGDRSDSGRRVLMWECYCDGQALKLDNERARWGEPHSISEDTRAQMKALEDRLGAARLPGLADRAAQVDREWASRLGTDPSHRELHSMRNAYSVIFRVGSAFAHPTLAGLAFVSRRERDEHVVDVRPRSLERQSLVSVPLMLATVLAVSAHVFEKPSMEAVNDYLDFLITAGASVGGGQP